MAGARLFIHEKAVKKDGTAAIYALVHISNKSIKINTGVSAVSGNFDKRKGRIRGTSKAAKDDNLIIDTCLGRINEILVRYRLQQKLLTADLLLREYKNPSLTVDFYAFMDAKLKERLKAREISPTSEMHQRGALRKLQQFKETLMFSEIDVKLIHRFRGWCRSSPRNNSVNTIQKTLAYWNIYMNIAKRDEIISYNPFDLVVSRRTESQRVYLTESELKKLAEYYKKRRYSDNLHSVLRHFLFMCYTGLRISDFTALKKENVQDDVLKFVPYKTRAKKQRELHVPLIDKAKELIRDENSQLPELFNTISDQKMNEYLKKIMDLAGIDKAVTNHSARHTFATLFLDKTNDVATLQRILGHSNIKETMIYVHISTKKIGEQMGEFGRLLAV